MCNRCYRHNGAGICEVWFLGHILEEKQEQYQYSLEARSG